jgi:TolB-like protein/tetratricopeptide (TPR) repeat protein
MTSWFAELKRRNVIRVGAAYVAVAWLLVQVADTVLPAFELPSGTLKTILIAIALGFPVTLVLAWVYELSPKGLRRTDDVPEADKIVPLSGRGLDFTIIGCMSVAILFLVFDNYIWKRSDAEFAASIAILPFTTQIDDVSGNPDSLYLGEGITDSLIMRLSRIPTLKVKSRTAIRDSDEDVQSLGNLLGVDAICLGSINQRGDTLEITAELISTVDGTILWSKRYQRQTSSLLTIESDISSKIAIGLQLELSVEEEETLARLPTSNPAAHRLFIQGRYFWNRRSEEGLRASADFYQRALALDPNYAIAWSGLADSYLMLVAWGIEPPADYAPRLVAAAERAIKLDPTLAEPHATLAYFKTLYEWDWEGARREFLLAIELNSNYSTAHHWYAFYLMTIGDGPASMEEILLAQEFEPLSPIINAEVGYFYLFNRQYAQALEELEKATLLDPAYRSTLSYLMRAYALLGQDDQAIATLKQWRTIAPADSVTNSYGSMVLPMLGLEKDAREVYQQALEASGERYVAPGLLGVLAATIGERDAAFEHFDRALEERSLIASWLRDPLLDGIHDDPRFPQIFERMGLNVPTPGKL